MPPKSWLGRLLIPLPGTLALGPVAHLPARLVKIAALAIPIGTYAEISVTRRLAGVAVAKAPLEEQACVFMSHNAMPSLLCQCFALCECSLQMMLGLRCRNGADDRERTP